MILRYHIGEVIPIPKRILLTDIVVSLSAAERMQLEGWIFEQNILKGTMSFTKFLYANRETGEIFERPYAGAQAVSISLITDQIFRAKTMMFGWVDDPSSEITSSSKLGRILSSYLLSTFERIGYHSFEKDIEKRTLEDYPLASDYIRCRCEELYNIEPPEVDIIVIPQPLWNTFKFDQGCDAEFVIKDGLISVPELKWRSKNFEESLIVHEVIHKIQRLKGWVLDIGELGLTSYDLGILANAVVQGRPLDLVSRDLGKDVNLIRRAKGIIDQKIEYMFKYFEIPCEVNAFAEQFRFLSHARNIPKDKVLDAMISRCQEKGGNMSSRDKELLSGMIYECDRKIEHSISEQEALVRYDHIPEADGSKTEFTDRDQETR